VRRASARLVEEQAIYEPILRSNVSGDRRTYGELALSGLRDQRNYSGTVSLDRLNSVGGTTSAGMTVSRQSSRLFSFPDSAEETQAELGISYTQPLLKGRGRTITELNIARARRLLRFHLETGAAIESAVLRDVAEAYLAFYQARQDLVIGEEILKNSREILRIIQEKFEMHAIPVIDLHKIESVVLEQEKDILRRRQAVRTLAEQLQFAVRTRIATGAFDDVKPRIDLERIRAQVPMPALEESCRLACARDQQLISLRNEGDQLLYDLTQARDELRPSLGMTAKASVYGFDDDNSVRAVSGLDAQNYLIGVELNFSWPVGNTAIQERIVALELALERNRLLQKNREHEIRKLLSQDFVRLKRLADEIVLDEKLVDITAKNLEAELDRLRGGRSLLLDTLVFQSDHFNAKLNHVRSQVNYLFVLVRIFYFRSEMRVFMP